jgi:hypothetical protein
MLDLEPIIYLKTATQIDRMPVLCAPTLQQKTPTNTNNATYKLP